MGVVNVTPDSFSDGGQFASAGDAKAHAVRLLEGGADLIDIGGESTRPGTPVQAPGMKEVTRPTAVSAEEELRRVLPVIEGVLRKRPDAIVSVDTYKACVAEEAVKAGALVINDVSGLTWDPGMAATLSKMGCGVILMHTRGRPEEWRNLPREPKIYEIVERELQETADCALEAGIEQDRIVLDPGLGFGKSFESNYQLLARLNELQKLGFPLLAGASRKSFLGRTAGARSGVDLPPDQRLHPSIAAAVIAALKGAHIVRVHDVRPTVEALAIADAVMQQERQ